MLYANEKALLPSGFQDQLYQDAARERHIQNAALTCFEQNAYRLVSPPLIEFETSLFTGAGKALTAETFRLMDPLSHQMLGMRADITPQIARIATTRLAGEPFPLRLCYSGAVLRVEAEDFYGQRQLVQTGIELIGSSDAAADSEVTRVVLEALASIGVADLSIDFSLPQLSRLMMQGLGFPEDKAKELQAALNAKNAEKVQAVAGEAYTRFAPLLVPTGNAKETLELLRDTPMPEEGRALCNALERVVALLQQERPAHLPEVTVTIDPFEYHGFEYYTGIGFAIFSKASGTEVARGGRYHIEGFVHPAQAPLEAVGCTIAINSLARILPAPESRKRICLPFGEGEEARRTLHAQGLVTVQLLEAMDDPVPEAKRLGCDGVFLGGMLRLFSD